MGREKFLIVRCQLVVTTYIGAHLVATLTPADVLGSDSIKPNGTWSFHY